MKKLLTALAIGAFTFGYTQSAYYNDYRSSISGINWQTVAAELLLTPQQKQQLFALNNQYDDYNSWNRVYGNNPDQWRYDRYGQLERILGKDKYTKFKNRYYKGQNPVAVYNRNKNNHKRYQNQKYNAIQNRKATNGNNRSYEYRKDAPKRSNSNVKSTVRTAPAKGKSAAAQGNRGNSQGKGKR